MIFKIQKKATKGSLFVWQRWNMCDAICGNSEDVDVESLNWYNLFGR